jgi:hypothetical protein
VICRVVKPPPPISLAILFHSLGSQTSPCSAMICCSRASSSQVKQWCVSVVRWREVGPGGRGRAGGGISAERCRPRFTPTEVGGQSRVSGELNRSGAGRFGGGPTKRGILARTERGERGGGAGGAANEGDGGGTSWEGGGRSGGMGGARAADGPGESGCIQELTQNLDRRHRRIQR